MKKRTPPILAIFLIVLTSCSTVSNSKNGQFAAPVRPKLVWVDEGARVSLNKEDAKKLYDYLVDIDAYVKKTGGYR